MQGGSADCWGVIAAEQGSSLGEKLPVSCLDMEQSSHQSSLRANSGFKGNEQQKGPTPNFKNSSKVAEPRSGSTSPILLRAVWNKTAASLGWMALPGVPDVLLRTRQKRLA